jgi:hypothetical protein
MSAQKTALVCLTILIVLIVHDALRLFAHASTSLAVRKDEIAFRICIRPDQRDETCPLLVRVQNAQ